MLSRLITLPTWLIYGDLKEKRIEYIQARIGDIKLGKKADGSTYQDGYGVRAASPAGGGTRRQTTTLTALGKDGGSCGEVVPRSCRDRSEIVTAPCRPLTLPFAMPRRTARCPCRLRMACRHIEARDVCVRRQGAQVVSGGDGGQAQLELLQPDELVRLRPAGGRRPPGSRQRRAGRADAGRNGGLRCAASGIAYAG